MSLTEKTLFGFFWMISGSVVQAILKIVILAVLARLISPEEFGVMGIATIALEFARVITRMAGEAALVQIKNIENRHITTGFTVTLLLNILLIILVQISAPFVASFFEMKLLENVLRLISLAFIFDAFALVAQSLLQRALKYKHLASLEVISYGLGFGAVGILMAYYGFGVWALLAAYVSQAAFLMILLFFIQPYPKKLSIDKKAFNELLSFGSGMSIARFWNFMANQGDNMIIGKFLGIASLGLYGRAYQIMVMPAKLIGTTMDKTLFPAMSSVQDKKSAVSNAYIAGVGMVSLISLPISVAIVLLAPAIVSVFLGEGWEGVILPLQILGSCLLFRMSFKISDSLVKAMGAVYERAWRQFAYAVMVFAGAYAGHFWGISGVAFGVCVALLINFLLMAQISLKLIDIRWIDFIMAHTSGILLSAFTGVLCYGLVYVSESLGLSALVTIIFCVIGAGIPSLFLMNYLTLNSKNKKIKDMRNMILKKITGKIGRN